MEVTPTPKRAMVGLFIWFPYSASISILAGLGYFLRDWRTLHFASSSFVLLTVPLTWLADESPRWMAHRGYSRKAKKILQKAAAWNRSTLPDEPKLDQILQNLAHERSNDHGNAKDSSSDFFSLVLKSGPLAIISLTTSAISFLVGVIYLGIPLGVSDFGGNPFLYLGVTGGVEFTASIIGSAFTKRFYKVQVMLSTCFMAACFRFAFLAVPEDMWWLKWLLHVVSMFMVNIAYLLTLVWASELYPTVVRAQGNGVFCFFNHLGYFVVPFITDTLSRNINWLPNVIFGICSALMGMLALVLPETTGLSLCDTVEEVEERWRKDKNKQRKKGTEVREVFDK